MWVDCGEDAKNFYSVLVRVKIRKKVYLHEGCILKIERDYTAQLSQTYVTRTKLILQHGCFCKTISEWAKGLQILPNIIMYKNGKIDSVSGSTLPKIRII